MNASAITYNSYQSWITFNPGSKPDNTDPIAKNDLAFQSVVNTNSSEQVPQSSEIDNTPQESNPSKSEKTETQTNPSTTQVNGQQLTQAEMKLIDELQQIDTEVRQHEMAHVAAGGRYITSGANFTYKRGPDGQNYAVGGEVSIDTSPVPGDPEATVQKMQQVKRAALAPADPSSQDIRVASKATQAASKALSDLMIEQAKEQADANEHKAFGNIKKAADSYEKVNNLPENDASSFQFAV